MDKQVKVSFQFCDFEVEYHCTMVATLINQYIADPMGGGTQLTKIQKLQLVDGLATHPSCFVLFAIIEDVIVGMSTCFINFSTFNVKPYINIHDLIVLKDFRRMGIGAEILTKCICIATERKYCKVTLEVRDDNIIAQSLYKSLGFGETDPVMRFWTKSINS
jgi:ribosomal protein S18 acetylase RimI-like enzyme